MRFTATIGALLILIGLSFPAEAQAPVGAKKSPEYPTATIREEQTLTVNGVSETWRLLWREAPKPYCEPSEESLTCPCAGFAFGEAGDLFLVRLRNGSEVERLHITPLFGETPGAALPRWPVNFDNDVPGSKSGDFASIVRKRPIVPIMHFEDYDHDGGKTEFYLQTEAISCGHSDGVVIGISKSDPRLHVFGTLRRPGKPLYLAKHEWDALRDSRSTTVNLVDWACLDHGADTQTELTLEWSSKGIDGVQREYTCPAAGESRTLLSEKPL